MKYVPSRKAVEHYGVDKRTLRAWCVRGVLDFTTLPGGQRRYAIPDANTDAGSPGAPKVSYCYCRVSSSKQKDDLARWWDSFL